MSDKNVLVLGGNFAGLTAALSLKYELGEGVDVTVVAKSDRFQFNPSFIWIPFGKRKVKDVVFPVATTFASHGVKFVHGEATEIDPAAQQVQTTQGILGFDYRWFVSWGWKREGRGLSHPAGSGGAAMTKRLPCPPAPGPLEGYAAQFDPLFARLAQRRGLRAYLQGLLLPRDRNKTLTCLAGAEPVVGAQQGAVQGLQFFLSESPWDHEQLNQRRVELLLGDPATAPHDHGVLVIDDTGDRKAGTKTANVARQYLGSVGKTDNGIVAVTSLWASERVYWPVHVVPYTPACRLPKGKRDPGFRTKPQLAAELVQAARQAGIGFRAVVADCFYGDNEGFTQALGHARVAYVLAVKPRKGVWAPADQTHTPREAAAELAWESPERPGDWTKLTRRFRDGHTQTWWAADARLPAAGWGPDRRLRLVVATTDPARLPKLTTWYLVTNLPHAKRRRAAACAPADLAEVVRLDGLRVCCAFSCCGAAWSPAHPAQPVRTDAQPAAARARGEGARRHGRQA